MEFLAERSAEYTSWWRRKKTPEQFKKDPQWMKQLNDPVDLFRIIRNATIPHDDSPSATAIQRGADLFISYFGKGNRVDAVRFLKEAHKFIVP